MIVRILGEGQYDVPEHALDALNGLDSEIEHAIDRGDHEMFRTALDGLLAAVRSNGTHHESDDFDESDLILPHHEATLDEVRELLGDDGLIPG